MLRRIISKISDKYLSFRWKSIIVNSKLGHNVFISKNSFISNSDIGAYSSIGRNSTVINSELGKFCSVSWNVTIGATSHDYTKISSHAFPYIKRFGFVNNNQRIVTKTNVGNDVWLGANAIILPGLTIGDGAVIAAGAVVTKNVPPYSISAGVPAEVIKLRFNETAIDRLLKLKWWNLNHDILKKNIDLWQNEFDSEIMHRLEKLCR